MFWSIQAFNKIKDFLKVRSLGVCLPDSAKVLGAVVYLVVDSYFENPLVGRAINRKGDPARFSLKQNSVARKPALSSWGLDTIENYEFIRAGNFVEESSPRPKVWLVNRQFQSFWIKLCSLNMLCLLPLAPAAFVPFLLSWLAKKTSPKIQAGPQQLVCRGFYTPRPLFCQALRSDGRIIPGNSIEAVADVRNFLKIFLRTFF